MRFDVVTIFPEYLAVLDVSLLGRARREGLVDVHVHDLRDFTFDRHRTVDDTPYGGGAGMVMKPEPWALALEHVAAQAPADAGERPVLLVPTPSGERFSQGLARELAQREHVAIACGRYEGIDERVFGWAEELFEVRLVSLGDSAPPRRIVVAHRHDRVRAPAEIAFYEVLLDMAQGYEPD